MNAPHLTPSRASPGTPARTSQCSTGHLLCAVFVYGLPVSASVLSSTCKQTASSLPSVTSLTAHKATQAQITQSIRHTSIQITQHQSTPCKRHTAHAISSSHAALSSRVERSTKACQPMVSCGSAHTHANNSSFRRRNAPILADVLECLAGRGMCCGFEALALCHAALCCW